jgi:membrane-associated phospholipid phosphatase
MSFFILVLGISIIVATIIVYFICPPPYEYMKGEHRIRASIQLLIGASLVAWYLSAVSLTPRPQIVNIPVQSEGTIRYYIHPKYDWKAHVTDPTVTSIPFYHTPETTALGLTFEETYMRVEQ